LTVRPAFDDFIELDEDGRISSPAERLAHEIDDSELSADTVPGHQASDQELRAFAVTTNGYRRMGAQHRLAQLSDKVFNEWRSSGTLTATLGELRCCLFAAQRAEHFGNSIPDGYVRALTDEIRRLVVG